MGFFNQIFLLSLVLLFAFCSLGFAQDDCSPNPCSPGNCTTIPGGGFYCTCGTGYTDTGSSCIQDPCSPSPCNSAQYCLVLSGYSAVCACPAGFRGPSCTQIEYCYPNPCANGGTCTNLDNGSGYNCTCSPGYLGTNCSQVDPCYNSPCLNGANCTGTEAAVCTCAESYYGTYCATYNPCFINPCQNGGNCTDQLQTAACTCPPGYTGTICESFDYCASNPCSSAATCSNQPTSYLCACPPGWQGYNCSEIDHCNPNPCQNLGTCNETNGNCTCPSGYYGSQCQLVDLCASSPCQNGGNCTRGETPLCSCATGTSGTYCQIVDPCYPNPCQNGGNCTNQVGTAVCSCATGYVGGACDQFDYCLSSPCVSNATCINSPTSYFCACSPGWKGPACSEPDACAPGPCQNGGTCIDLGGGVANCSCPNAYTGTYCSYANPCYNSGPCVNGATCTISRSYTANCTCAVGYTGTTCSTVDPCNPNPCHYGGTCYESLPGTAACDCLYNTTGTSCQFVIQLGLAPLSSLPAIYGAFSQNELSLNFSTNLCDQIGITCDPDNGQVIEIDLSNSNLMGTIPVSLGLVTTLQKIYLDGNKLTGTIPASLYQLSSLQILDLSSNNLTGTIPNVFSQLSSLSVLQLDHNMLTGTVPSFFANMSLVQLDLASNLFCPQVNYSTFASLTDYAAPTSACAVCTSQTCLNGGTCTVSSGAFHCTCLPGFVGAHCDQTICDLQPCQNGGVCSQTGSEYSCSCVGTIFIGTNCTELCGEDTYKDLTTSNSCIACPNNSSSFGQTGLSSPTGCLCISNFYLNASQICEACPANSKSAPGSTSISSCFCDSGLGGSSGVCDPCPVDTYRDLTTPGTCTTCPSPSTTFNMTGLSSISSCGCPANYYGYSGSCTSCPSGTSSASNSPSSTNCDCIPGYGGPLGGPCTPCPVNTYSVSPNLCVSCPLGSFTGDATGQSNATDCQCGNGYYGVNANCTACPSGSTSPYNSTDESSCYCIQGYVGSNGVPPCSICPIDTYYYNSTYCSSCPANSGTKNLTGTVSPNSCSCYPGFYGTPGNCSACPSYQTSPYGSLSESACQCLPGFVNNSGECACPAGSYPDGDVCSVCPGNSYGDGSGPCVTCPAGSGISPRISGASDFSYCQCLNGYYGSSASDCVACPAYSTTNSMGSTSFANCTCLPTFEGTPGSCYCPTGTGIYYNACLTCPADTYISAGICVSCPDNSGTFGLSGQTSISSCTCNPGFYGTVTTSCSPCPALSNSTQNTTTINGCECVSGATVVSGACVCSPGYVPVNNTCEACGPDTYSASNGTCVSCPSSSSTFGLTTQSSIAACQCVPNTYGSSGNCTTCPCVNGVCNQVGSSFTCDCTYTNYFGNLCQTPNGCFSNPCQNGGFCSSSNIEYTCDCTDTGYIGSNCQYRGVCSVVNEGNAAWPSAETFNLSPGTCNTGFYGSPTRYCLANETFGPISNPCVPIAGNCPSQLGYTHANWPSTLAGTTATGTCITGWQGSPTRICQDDGTWQTLVSNQCQRIVCPTAIISNATFSQTFASYSSTGTCAQGLSGAPVRLCQNNGTWGPDTGTACFTPGSCVPQLYLRANWAETLPGATATGVCIDGWTGNPTRICKTSGVWETLVNNQCARVICPATTLANATFPRTNALSSSKGTCVSGTYGAPVRECLDNGTWGSSTGTACASKCPAETLYMNASWPATIPGTVAKGTCASGYRGNPSRTCNSSGVWDTSLITSCVPT